MFLYCAASSVPIWSGKSILLHLGPSSVFFLVRNKQFFTSFTAGNIYRKKIDWLLYDWEYLGIGLSDCA